MAVAIPPGLTLHSTRLRMLNPGPRAPAAAGGSLTAGNNILKLSRGLSVNPAVDRALVTAAPKLARNPYGLIVLGAIVAGAAIWHNRGWISTKLQQVWGYLDSPRTTKSAVMPAGATAGQKSSGMVSLTGTNTAKVTFTQFFMYTGNPGQYDKGTYTITVTFKGVGGYFQGVGPKNIGFHHYHLWGIDAAGKPVDLQADYGGSGSSPDFGLFTEGISWDWSTTDPNPVPVNGDYGLGTAYQPAPFWPGTTEPVTEPQPQPLPITPTPLPLPAAPPEPDPTAEPKREPARFPIPGNPPSPYPPAKAPPSTKPKLPPRLPAQQPKPADVVDLGPDAKPKPQPKPLPKPTPGDSHFIDGIEIGTGQPRADLESIAKEVGRIENKLAIALPQVGQLVPKANSIFDSLDELKSLWDLIMNRIDSGEYQLSSPCVLDEDGVPIVETVAYSGGDTLQTISNKIDALSYLLQIHKNLKQPNCPDDGPSMPKSNFTVTFTEVL